MIAVVLHTFFLLVVMHCLADFPLQGEFLSRAKNPKTSVDGIPWPHAMAAHCLIHAGGVWLVTGNYLLAILEAVSHWIIDYLRCTGRISFTVDQTLHIACKIVWIALLFQAQWMK